MVLDRLVIWFVRAQLRRLLGAYTSNLDIQLQSGVLRLNHVVLSIQALAKLGLPLAVQAATIRKLEVLLPWREGAQRNAPFIVRLDGVSLVLCSRMEADDLDLSAHKRPPSHERSQDAQAREQQGLSREWLSGRKAARLHKPSDLAGEPDGGATDDNDDTAAAPVRLDASQQQALLDMVLRSLVISVTNVSVRLQEGFGDDAAAAPTGNVSGDPQVWAAATRPASRSRAALEARLDSLSLRCRRESGLPGLLAMLPIPAWLPWPRRPKRSREQTAAIELDATISVFWQDGNSSSASISAPTLATDALAGGEVSRVPILPPLGLKATLDMVLRWPKPPDAPGEAASQDGPHLQLRGGAVLSEVQLLLPRAMLCTVVRLVRRIIYAEAFERHRHLRPRGSVARLGARRWWRYACSAVREDLSQERGTAAHRTLKRQAALVVEYENLLRRSGWGNPGSVKDLPKPTAAQLALEAQIEEATILRARRRVIERGRAAAAAAQPARVAHYRDSGRGNGVDAAGERRAGGGAAAVDTGGELGLENLFMDVSLKVVSRGLTACAHLTESTTQRAGAALTLAVGVVSADVQHVLRRGASVYQPPNAGRNGTGSEGLAPAAVDGSPLEGWSTRSAVSASLHSVLLYLTPLRGPEGSSVTSPRQHERSHAEGPRPVSSAYLLHLSPPSESLRRGSSATPACQLTASVDARDGALAGVSAGVCVSQPLSLWLHLGVIPALADFGAVVAPPPPPHRFSRASSTHAARLAVLEQVIERLALAQLQKRVGATPPDTPSSRPRLAPLPKPPPLESLTGRGVPPIRAAVGKAPLGSFFPPWLHSFQLDVGRPVSAAIITPDSSRLYTPVVQLPRMHMGLVTPMGASDELLRLWLHAGISASWVQQATLHALSSAAASHAATAAAPSAATHPTVSRGPSMLSPHPPPLPALGSLSLRRQGSSGGSSPRQLSGTPRSPRGPSTLSLPGTPVSRNVPAAKLGTDASLSPKDTLETMTGGAASRRSLVETIASFFSPEATRAAPADVDSSQSHGKLSFGASLAHTLTFGHGSGGTRAPPMPPGLVALPPPAELCAHPGARPLLDAFEASLSLSLPAGPGLPVPAISVSSPAQQAAPNLSANASGPPTPGRAGSRSVGSLRSPSSSKDPFEDLEDDFDLPQGSSDGLVRPSGGSALSAGISGGISEGSLGDDDDDDALAAAATAAAAAAASAKLPSLTLRGALPMIRVHAGMCMLGEALDLIDHVSAASEPLVALHREVSIRWAAAAPRAGSAPRRAAGRASPTPRRVREDRLAPAEAGKAAGLGGLGPLHRARVRLQLHGIEVSIGLADCTGEDHQLDESDGEADPSEQAKSRGSWFGRGSPAPERASVPATGSSGSLAGAGPRRVFGAGHASLALRLSALEIAAEADAGGATVSAHLSKLELLDCRRGVPAAACCMVDLNADAPPPMRLGLVAAVLSPGNLEAAERRAATGGRSSAADVALDGFERLACKPLLSAQLRRGDVTGGVEAVRADIAVVARAVALQWSPGIFALGSYTLLEASQVLAEAAADRQFEWSHNEPSSVEGQGVGHTPPHAGGASDAGDEPAAEGGKPPPAPLLLKFSADVDQVKLAFNAEPLSGPWAGQDWDPAAGETFEVAPEGLPAGAAMPHIILLTVDDVRLALTQLPPPGPGTKPDLSLVIRASLDSMVCPEDQRPAAATFVMARALPPPEPARQGGQTDAFSGRSGGSGAQAVVALDQNTATGGAIDVTVDIDPLYFELRIAPLLRAIEFIERSIRKPLVRLASGGQPLPPAPIPDPASAAASALKRPRWKILVPAAVLSMPTAADGHLEFRCVNASVGSTSIGDTTLMDLIKVDVSRVFGVAIHPRGRGPPRHLALTIVEEQARFELTLRKPLSNAAAAALGIPFQELIIDLTKFGSTIHLGLAPADFGLLLAVWLDNFNVNPVFPKDPARAKMEQRGTTQLKVVVKLPQAVLWLHDAAESRALLQLRLDSPDIDVDKRLDGRTYVRIAIPGISSFVSGEAATGASRWFQMIGPPLETPAAAAEARAAAALRGSLGDHSLVDSPASEAEATARVMGATGVQVALATKGGEAEQVDVSIGRLGISVLPAAALGLAEFGVHAMVAASTVLSARKARFMARDGALPPPPPPQGQELRLAIPMVQLMVTEPAPGAPDDQAGVPGSADGSGEEEEEEEGTEGPGALPMAPTSARAIAPRLLAVHVSLAMESLRVPDHGGQTPDRDSQAGSRPPPVVYDQMALQVSHMHSCLALGHYGEPRPNDWLRTPAVHASRACSSLCGLASLPSARDRAASLLEPFALHMAQSARPGQKQTSLTLDQPLRASISLEMLLFLDAVAAAYRHTAETFPIDLTRPPDPNADAAAPAALGGGGPKKARAAETQETMLATVPAVEVTLLSCDRPSLPLLQLALGADGLPITLTTEKLALSAPLAAEVLVPLSTRFYNCALLCWEPVIEPLKLRIRVQQSTAATAAGLSSITLSLRDSLELNVSDTMLADAQANLQALLRARAARQAEWRAHLDRPIRGRALASPGAAGGKVEDACGCGAAHYWIVNETGEELRYWATEESDTPAVPGGSRTLASAMSASEPPPPPMARSNTRRVHELAAGSCARLSLWDADAAEVLARAGWCEDTPRRLTLRLPGSHPLAGVMVNRMGTSILPVESTSPLAHAGRALVCEVEHRGGGTRLTLRSMVTLVNCTQRTLVVDIELPDQPMQHAGILRPGGSTLSVSREQLEGGLRLTDCGTGDAPPAAVKAALDAADVSSAVAKGPPYLWLPALLACDEPAPTAEEEATWRSSFSVADYHYLVRATPCSLLSSDSSMLSKATTQSHAGELFLGSTALYFHSHTTFQKRNAARERNLIINYSSVVSINKKTSRLPTHKGFTLTLAAGGGPSSVTISSFTYASANQIRHLLETLLSRCSPRMRREMSAENVALRARFHLEHEPDLFVLQEYACALVHADGSARGKLYVTQRYLCFKGSLFGRETRATYPFDEILSIEPVETPTPNSITLTCTTSEERLAFLQHRGHALALLCQLHAVAHSDHLLPTPRDTYGVPQEAPELKPSPFLERARPQPQPFAIRPLRLGDGCHLLATCWRYPVKASLVTGCPARLLVQAPAAVQNLLPEPLEWRVTWAKGEAPLQHDELPPHGGLHEVHSMVTGAKYGLQLRLPGYDWSSPIELDPQGMQRGADRIEMVRLRPRPPERAVPPPPIAAYSDGTGVSDEASVAGDDTSSRETFKSARREKRQERRAEKAVTAATSSLKLLVQHRSDCECARHLLQVYATHWLINGTGLTLEFRVGRKKAHAHDRPGAVDTVEEAEAEARAVAEAAAGERIDDAGGAVEEESGSLAIEEQTMSDEQTLLESVAHGSRHSLAVRVIPDPLMRQVMLGDKASRKEEADGGWSAPFSLLVGLGQLELGSAAARSLRAGKYDLALHITPLANADHGRIKVVKFVQRFWLSNRVGLVLEVEQHDPKAGGGAAAAAAAAAALAPAAASSEPGEGEARREPWGRKESFSRGRARKKERAAAVAQRAIEQREQRALTPLAANERAPWHWPSLKEEPLLRVRAAPGQGEMGFLPGPDEGWSSAFPIDAPGTFVVFCEQGIPRHEPGWWASLLRILVSVELVDARIEVMFELAPPAPPPIRIVNQTRCGAAFWQKAVEGGAASPHRAPAGEGVAFAWREPQMEHTLCVSLFKASEGLASREPPSISSRRSEPWRFQSQRTLVESYPVNLDAFDQPVPLIPGKGGRGEHRDTTESDRFDEEEDDDDRSEHSRSEGSGRSRLKMRKGDKNEPVAWAHVALLDGVRVLTLSEARPDTTGSISADEAHLIIVVDVAAFGVSLIHASGGQEVLYISGVGLKLDAVLSADVATSEVQLALFQIDNQLSSATLPAVLSLSGSSPKEGRPALHLSVVRKLRTRGGSVDWWEYVSCRLLELELAAEPTLVQALLDFLFAARIPGLIRLLNAAQFDAPKARPALTDGLAPPKVVPRTRKRRGRRLSASTRGLLRYGAPERLQYFKKLELHPIRVCITFHHNNNLGFGRGSAALLVPIPHIDEAPIHLSALLREHLVGTSAELGASIANHYKFSLLRQLMRVLLQVDMLGDPVGFVRTWGTGVKDLFYLPALAVVHKPSTFGRAVAAGGASFAQKTLGAPINSLGKFVSSAARSSDRTLAAMDMGRTGGHWAEARYNQRTTSMERGAVAAAKQSGRQLMDGTTKLGLGIISGVVGIVREPVKGAMNDGVRGFSIGVGKGIAGAALRPTAGVLHFASGMTNAMQQLGGETEATMTHSARIGRRRPPRMLHPLAAAHASSTRCRIVCYSLAEALAQQVLHSAGEGHYVHESMLRFELLLPPLEGAKPLVLVLTGVRLLVVDTANWHATTNMPLRKVQAAEPSGPSVVLILASRRGAAGGSRDVSQAASSRSGGTANDPWDSVRSEASEWQSEQSQPSQSSQSTRMAERSDKSSKRLGGAEREKRVLVQCYDEALAVQLSLSIEEAAIIARTRRTAVFEEWRKWGASSITSASLSAAGSLGIDSPGAGTNAGGGGRILEASASDLIEERIEEEGDDRSEPGSGAMG
jgi:hypothetical protein